MTTNVKTFKSNIGTTQPDRQQQIDARLRQMPESCRRTYNRAVSGKSKASAVRAFCQECVGYVRAEVTACTDVGCPLWPYRPYQKDRNLTRRTRLRAVFSS